MASSVAREDGTRKRPRCGSCRGEMIHVVVSYGHNDLRYEWECVSCGKSVKSDEHFNVYGLKKSKRPRNMKRKNGNNEWKVKERVHKR